MAGRRRRQLARRDQPSLSWLYPFGEGGAALTAGLLLGVFIYWGWESAVNLTEETTDSASAPGRAGLWSTVILLVTYVSVAYGVVAYAGHASSCPTTPTRRSSSSPSSPTR